jgi:hypothetical protein
VRDGLFLAGVMLMEIAMVVVWLVGIVVMVLVITGGCK